MVSQDVVKTPSIDFGAKIGGLLATFGGREERVRDSHTRICTGADKVFAVVVQNVSSVRSYHLGVFQASTPIPLASTGVCIHRNEQLVFSRHRCNSLPNLVWSLSAAHCVGAYATTNRTLFDFPVRLNCTLSRRSLMGSGVQVPLASTISFATASPTRGSHPSPNH